MVHNIKGNELKEETNKKTKLIVDQEYKCFKFFSFRFCFNNFLVLLNKMLCIEFTFDMYKTHQTCFIDLMSYEMNIFCLQSPKIGLKGKMKRNI